MELDRERWEGVTDGEREAIARRLARELPAGFAFHSVQPHTLGECRNHVALYQYDSATFALIPGGPVTLGYDSNRAWKPNPEELESWQSTVDDFGYSQTQAEWIQAVTPRPYEAVYEPFLVGTTPCQMWVPIPVDDPAVREVLPTGAL